MANSTSSRWRRLGQGALALLLTLCLLITLGLSASDDAAFRSFQEAARRWQVNPEYRSVTFDYCTRGSRALRTRPMFMQARHMVLLIRSLPFVVPKEFAVNEASHLHYDNFTRGPLSAYLHLCSEQQVSQYVEIFENIGQRPTTSQADERELLGMFKMDFPVVSDGGALQGVGTMLQDSQAYRHFSIRDPIGKHLLAHIASVAHELGIDPDVTRQSPDQQQAVFERLDAYVKEHDIELWRTKQVSDFCSGIWAQVYAPAYCWILDPLVVIRQVCLWTLLVGLTVIVVTQSFYSVRKAQAGAARPQHEHAAVPGKTRFDSAALDFATHRGSKGKL